MTFEEKKADIVNRLYEVCAVNGLTVNQVHDVAMALTDKADAQVKERFNELWNETLE